MQKCREVTHSWWVTGGLFAPSGRSDLGQMPPAASSLPGQLSCPSPRGRDGAELIIKHTEGKKPQSHPAPASVGQEPQQRFPGLLLKSPMEQRESAPKNRAMGQCGQRVPQGEHSQRRPTSGLTRCVRLFQEKRSAFPCPAENACGRDHQPY